MSDIPCELFDKILKLVPVEHLFPLRLVSKEWRSFIDSFVFPSLLWIRSTTSKGKIYSLSLPSLDIAAASSSSEEEETKEQIGTIEVTNIKNPGKGAPGITEFPLPSCHGLILIPSKLVTKDWALWSPFNGSAIHLIPPYNGFATTEKGPKSRRRPLFYGLGYDASTSDYKVVRVARIYGPKRNSIFLFKTLIYSLKSQAWHRIEDFPRDSRQSNHAHPRGVFMKGALHWIADVDDHGKCIVVLDLCTESYRMMPLPLSVVSIHRVHMYLDVLGGYLFLSCNGLEGYPWVKRSLWILNDYGGENRWTMLISNSVDQDRETEWYTKPMRPVACAKSIEQVIIHYDRDKLMWFDICKKECLKKVTVKGFEKSGFSCGKCHAAGHDSIDKVTGSKRNRVEIEYDISEFEISVCKRPKRWVEY